MSTTQRDRTKANPHARGTSNGNERGSSVVRKERKAWLLEQYAADRPLIKVTWAVTGETTVDSYVVGVEALLAYEGVLEAEEVPTARCYQCGALLWMETITVDRIKPGVFGGKYRTPKMDTREGVTNVRPACALHNSSTGGALANAKKHAPAKHRVRRMLAAAAEEMKG